MKTLSPHRRADTALRHYVTGWLALVEGDLPRAKQETEAALAMGVQIGWKHVRSLNLFCLAEILIECGEYVEAQECLARYRSEFPLPRAPMLEFHARLIEAYGAQRQHDEARCALSLRAGLALGRTHGYVNNLRWYPPMMARLAAFALEHDIEPDYVRMLIRRRGLLPEAPVERWPWPVRVYTLGRFAILRDDEPVEFAGKAQRKPLELLKVLIALGGKDVPTDRLIGALWPVSPEDGGHKALEITVHRLRKLLGVDDAVRVSDRHISLNARYVWVDAWSLERHLAAVTQSANGGFSTERVMADILELYRGHFLASDVEEGWQIPMRNRLNGRFQRFVLHAGERCENAGEWQRAEELYARVVELDPLAEIFYRRRMICLDALGRRAEAIEVFRRLRQTFSVVLGIAPGSESVALYKRLLD